MTSDVLAYQIDLPDIYDPQYLCVDCGREADNDWDYFDGVTLIPITDAAKLPEGPHPALGYECDGPFCSGQRLPVPS